MSSHILPTLKSSYHAGSFMAESTLVPGSIEQRFIVVLETEQSPSISLSLPFRESFRSNKKSSVSDVSGNSSKCKWIHYITLLHYARDFDTTINP